MAEVRISEMTAHSTGVLAATDLIEVSEDLGGGLFGSRKLTGANLFGLVYKAIIAQVSTNDPTATVLKNTLGTVTLARVGVGDYELTCTGAFSGGATKLFISASPLKTITTEVRVYRENSNVVKIRTYASGTLTDALLPSTEPLSLLLEVYP
jgi:hypothetical protein